MLETGQYARIKEIAKAEKINPSYVSRVLRLTLLAPDLVEALVHGRQTSTMSLHNLMKPFPIEWHRQRGTIRGRRAGARSEPTCGALSTSRGRLKAWRAPYPNVVPFQRTARIDIGPPIE